LRLYAVAIHVGEAECGHSRTPLAAVELAAAGQRIDERRLWTRQAKVEGLTGSSAPQLVLTHPHRPAVALLDMWRAQAQ